MSNDKYITSGKNKSKQRRAAKSPETRGMMADIEQVIKSVTSLETKVIRSRDLYEESAFQRDLAAILDGLAQKNFGAWCAEQASKLSTLIQRRVKDHEYTLEQIRTLRATLVELKESASGTDQGTLFVQIATAVNTLHTEHDQHEARTRPINVEISAVLQAMEDLYCGRAKQIEAMLSEQTQGKALNALSDDAARQAAHQCLLEANDITTEEIK